MSYCTVDNVKRLLWRTTGGGTAPSGIWIGTTAGRHMGTTDVTEYIRDADWVIDNRLSHLGSTPFGSPYPYIVRWISMRLAASFIITAVKQFTSDSASNFLFDKQQMLYYMAMNKLEAIASGQELLRGIKVESIPQKREPESDFGFQGLGTVAARPGIGM